MLPERPKEDVVEPEIKISKKALKKQEKKQEKKQAKDAKPKEQKAPAPKKEKGPVEQDVPMDPVSVPVSFSPLFVGIDG